MVGPLRHDARRVLLESPREFRPGGRQGVGALGVSPQPWQMDDVLKNFAGIVDDAHGEGISFPGRALEFDYGPEEAAVADYARLHNHALWQIKFVGRQFSEGRECEDPL